MVYSQTSYRPTPTPSDRATQQLQDELLHFFNVTCPDRHDVRIPVSSPETSGGPDGGDGLLRFELPGLPPVDAHVTAHHVGGNVYEISGGLEGRPAETFSCCLSSSPCFRSCVERTIGAFLLMELKCFVGAYVLRNDERLRTDAPSCPEQPEDNRPAKAHRSPAPPRDEEAVVEC